MITGSENTVVIIVEVSSPEAFSEALRTRDSRNGLHDSLFAAVIDSLFRLAVVDLPAELVSEHPELGFTEYTLCESRHWAVALDVIRVELTGTLAAGYSRWFYRSIYRTLREETARYPDRLVFELPLTIPRDSLGVSVPFGKETIRCVVPIKRATVRYTI